MQAELQIQPAITSETSLTEWRVGLGPLSSTQRLVRMAEILHRAACRSQNAGQGSEPHNKVVSDLPEAQMRIFGAIRDMESVTPGQVLALVQMSRASVARHLKSLLDQGLVERTGQTRQARYKISGKPKNMGSNGKNNHKPPAQSECSYKAVRRVTESENGVPNE